MTALSDSNAYRKIQHRILLLLFFAITINILDRQVLSLVAPVLRDELHLSNTQYGTIVFCFLLGMGVGQVPAGALIDRYGARRGLAMLIVWWSTANLAHAFMRTVLQFGAMRFLLGIGECGNYSAGIKVIGQWFPPHRRALAAGLFNGGSLIGAIIAPPLVTWLLLHYGWQSAFLLPSAAGLLWLLPWLRTYWEPWRHPGLHGAVPPPPPQTTADQPGAAALLAMPAVWGVVLMRAFTGPVSHFYWYWLPEYLKHGRGMSLETIGATAWMPFLAGAIGNIGGGWASGALMSRGWTAQNARTALISAATLGCLSAVLVPLSPTPAAALALICIASLSINAFSANHMGVIIDLFPQNVLARIAGMTGVGDNVISMAAMLLTGVVVDRFSYTPVFIVVGCMPVLALAAYFTLARPKIGMARSAEL
jgi:ACS family hexuronate transporter-like MFS transporter